MPKTAPFKVTHVRTMYALECNATELSDEHVFINYRYGKFETITKEEFEQSFKAVATPFRYRLRSFFLNLLSEGDFKQDLTGRRV